MPTQAATTDLIVCWMPSLHRGQETISTKGPRAALITVGAMSVGRIRVASKSRHGWSEGAYLDEGSKTMKQQLDSKRS